MVLEPRGSRKSPTLLVARAGRPGQGPGDREGWRPVTHEDVRRRVAATLAPRQIDGGPARPHAAPRRARRRLDTSPVVLVLALGGALIALSPSPPKSPGRTRATAVVKAGRRGGAGPSPACRERVGAAHRLHGLHGRRAALYNAAGDLGDDLDDHDGVRGEEYADEGAEGGPGRDTPRARLSARGRPAACGLKVLSSPRLHSLCHVIGPARCCATLPSRVRSAFHSIFPVSLSALPPRAHLDRPRLGRGMMESVCGSPFGARRQAR